MVYINHKVFTLFFCCLLSFGCSNTQTESSNKLLEAKATIVEPTGVEMVDGVFKSNSGGFTIAVGKMPVETIDVYSETAKAKKIDAGRMFFWKLDRTVCSVHYMFPFDADGNPTITTFEAMISGTRASMLEKGRIIEEKSIDFTNHQAKEIHFMNLKGKHITRVYFNGDIFYVNTCSYVDDETKKRALDVLDSFTTTYQ